MEAYKVGVVVALNNQVSSVLGLIARDFIKTDKEAKALQRSLKEIKLLGMSGAVIGGAGFMGLMAIKSAVKPATEYVHQLELAKAAGMQQLEIAQATKAAWAATGQVMTTTAAGNLAAVRELRMVFGDTQDAVRNMATVQKLQSVLQNVRGGNAHDEAYTVAKALEMKGYVKNPGQFDSAADLMTKAIIASGGKVAAQDFLSAFKYGRSATLGWDDRFTFGILPTLIQEMKSSGGSGGAGGPGNALMSAYAAVVGGTIPQKSLKLWQHLGLLDPSKIVWDKVGSAKGIAPGGIIGSGTFQQDPYQWTQHFLVPALIKAGYDTEEKQRQALQYLFPNRTAGFVMGQMALQAWKFERDQKLIGQASGLSAYDEMIKRDPVMASRAAAAQWENLKTALGIELIPILLPFIHKLAEAFQTLARFAQNHPTLTTGLMATFGALSLFATIGGTLLVSAAAFKLIGVALGPLGIAAAAPAAATALSTLATAVGLLGLSVVTARATMAAGDWLDSKLHAKEDAELRAHFQNFTPPPRGNHATIEVPVNLDGRQIAKVVTGYQYDIWGKAPASGGGFDGRQSFVPAVSP